MFLQVFFYLFTGLFWFFQSLLICVYFSLDLFISLFWYVDRSPVVHLSAGLFWSVQSRLICLQVSFDLSVSLDMCTGLLWSIYTSFLIFSKSKTGHATDLQIDVTMWRNRHICTKFQENRHIFRSMKKKISKPGKYFPNHDLQRQVMSQIIWNHSYVCHDSSVWQYMFNVTWVYLWHNSSLRVGRPIHGAILIHNVGHDSTICAT